MAKDVICQVSWRQRGREGVMFIESAKASWEPVLTGLCEIMDKAKGQSLKVPKFIALIHQSLKVPKWLDIRLGKGMLGPDIEAPCMPDQ